MEEEKQEDHSEEGTGWTIKTVCQWGRSCYHWTTLQWQTQTNATIRTLWDFILRQCTATKILVTLVHYTIVSIFKV